MTLREQDQLAANTTQTNELKLNLLTHKLDQNQSSQHSSTDIPTPRGKGENSQDELQSPQLEINLTVILILNFVSVVGVVAANKSVFYHARFEFPCVLTAFHALATALGMALFARIKLFEAKQIPFEKLLVLTGMYVMYIISGNVNIHLNAVGFYQISKIAIMPVVLIIQAIVFNNWPSAQVTLAVCLVVVGLILAIPRDDCKDTNLDEEQQMYVLNYMVGFWCTLSSALYTVQISRAQKQLEATGSQLLYQYSPIAFMLIGIIASGDESIKYYNNEYNITQYEPSKYGLLVIFASSCLGLSVTYSTFLLIGASSPLTYCVISQLKSLLIFLIGWVVFDEQYTKVQIVGIGITLVGLFIYSYLKAVSK